MSDTFWAIRRREMAKHEPPVKKGKKAKKEKVVEQPIEEKAPISEADSLADLAGEPRPDNPTVEPEAPAEEPDESSGG